MTAETNTQQKHPDSPLWHPAVPLTLRVSLRCLLSIHHWPKWSQVYSGIGQSALTGERLQDVKMQERYCQHCNRREARNAI